MLFPAMGSITSLAVRVAANIMAGVPFTGHRSIFWSIPVGWALGTVVVFRRCLSGKWKRES